MTKEDLRAVVDLIADLKQERDRADELCEKAQTLTAKAQDKWEEIHGELMKAKERIRELDDEQDETKIEYAALQDKFAVKEMECLRQRDRIRELEIQSGHGTRCKSQRGTGGGSERCVLVESHSCDHKFPSDIEGAIQSGQDKERCTQLMRSGESWMRCVFNAGHKSHCVYST